MNYDIKLYVHGVPKGQCLWGVGNLDSNYIETFYGRKSNIPAQMFAEIHKFGSSAYSYYTYYVGNTSEYDGRPGGYFALTLRINYYYADIQNVYNLLDAAFNKFIVGSVVKAANSVFRYTISDFSQVDGNLKTLEEEINKYLMQFSSNSDFVPLNGFKANGRNEVATLNLLECDAKAVANHVKNYSSISISPYHPSSREQRIINEMNVKINAVNTQAQQQITAARQNARHDVDAARTQAQQDVAAAQHDKEIGIQTIKDKYKDADKTINSLNEKINKVENEKKRLNEEVKKLELKVQHDEDYKNKFESAQKELEKFNAVKPKVNECISGLNDIAESLGMSSNSSHEHVHGGDSKRKEERISFMKIIRGIHPFTDFLFMIVLLCIIASTLPKSCNNEKELIVANERIEQLEKQLEDTQGKSTIDTVTAGNIKTDGGAVEEHQPTLSEIFPNARINIAGIRANKPMKYRNTYTVSLKGVEGELGGHWESSDFTIYNGNKITPKHAGPCKISYVVDGAVLVARTITVVE